MSKFEHDDIRGITIRSRIGVTKHTRTIQIARKKSAKTKRKQLKDYREQWIKDTFKTD